MGEPTGTVAEPAELLRQALGTVGEPPEPFLQRLNTQITNTFLNGAKLKNVCLPPHLRLLEVALLELRHVQDPLERALADQVKVGPWILPQLQVLPVEVVVALTPLEHYAR